MINFGSKYWPYYTHTDDESLLLWKDLNGECKTQHRPTLDKEASILPAAKTVHAESIAWMTWVSPAHCYNLTISILIQWPETTHMQSWGPTTYLATLNISSQWKQNMSSEGQHESGRMAPLPYTCRNHNRLSPICGQIHSIWPKCQGNKLMRLLCIQ